MVSISLLFTVKQMMIRARCLIGLTTVMLCQPILSVAAQDTEPVQTSPESEPLSQIEREIMPVLNRQAQAWNRGDLEAFMQAYWNSEQLTFSSGGKTTRGWQATLANYRKSYPTRKQMGHLSFDQLEFNPIESSAALVLGQWHLTMDDGTKIEGNFSIILRKFDGTWKIIHDHSSTLESEVSDADEVSSVSSTANQRASRQAAKNHGRRWLWHTPREIA